MIRPIILSLAIMFSLGLSRSSALAAQKPDSALLQLPITIAQYTRSASTRLSDGGVVYSYTSKNARRISVELQSRATQPRPTLQSVIARYKAALDRSRRNHAIDEYQLAIDSTFADSALHPCLQEYRSIAVLRHGASIVGLFLYAYECPKVVAKIEAMEPEDEITASDVPVFADSLAAFLIRQASSRGPVSSDHS